MLGSDPYAQNVNTEVIIVRICFSQRSMWRFSPDVLMAVSCLCRCQALPKITSSLQVWTLESCPIGSLIADQHFSTLLISDWPRSLIDLIEELWWSDPWEFSTWYKITQCSRKWIISRRLVYIVNYKFCHHLDIFFFTGLSFPPMQRRNRAICSSVWMMHILLTVWGNVASQYFISAQLVIGARKKYEALQK